MQQRPWLMVLEFLEYGDLRSVLKGFEAKYMMLSYSEQLTIACQVSLILHHLKQIFRDRVRVWLHFPIFGFIESSSI